MEKKREMSRMIMVFAFIFSFFSCFVFLFSSNAMAQTGAISGRVTDGSVGISDIWVRVYDSNCNYLDAAPTDSNGDYTVTGLPSGDHKVEFVAHLTDYATEWYNDKYDFVSADPVTVTAPGTTAGINAVLELGGSISGQVTDGSAGISDVSVHVYNSIYNYLESASTDSNGDYTVTNLPSGDHKVIFDASTGYLSEWYNDKADFGSADPVTVTAPGAATDINAVLELGGSISGQVTDGSAGISGVRVYVYDSSNSYLESAPTDINGDYTVTGLPSGDHKMIFDASNTGYASEWYNDKADFGSADPVTVTTPNNTPNIDAVLQKFGDEFAVDFGPNGLWHYDGSWGRLSNWDPDDDLAGWRNGLAVDFGSGRGLWNRGGTSWSRLSDWDVDSGGMAGWSGGLAVDFNDNGLWNHDGSSWHKMTNWNPDDDLVGWQGGLAVDFGGNGLWNYDGSWWWGIAMWNIGSAGLASWSGGLATDFDGNGLWNYDDTTWSKLSNWDPDDDLAGWPGGLAVDFGGNGLWNNDGTSWTRLSNWDPEGMTGVADGLVVDFDGNGVWKYDGSSWIRLSNWNAENMADCDLN